MLTSADIESFEKAIGYTFKDKALITQAFTHSSFVNEQKINKKPDYERLEFLGDAVLEMISSAFLFRKYPQKKEGELSKIRASLVCEPALAFASEKLNIKKYMQLGKGEEATGGRNKESIIADMMEAVIGALFLDGGIEESKRFIDTYVLTNVESMQMFSDSKSILQEIAQGQNLGAVTYEICGESGPEHDKIFDVRVFVGDKNLGEGSGKTKKAAEQKAAYEALLVLKKKNNVFKEH
ncbi:MAG: ribonuclease III [Butyrivibrio sp.]|jgi:ribonuclease-3|uniref:ribonuclease III n=1 Tax=Butyrivibrio sp. TaxID=28121 RepID=UPI001EBFFD28|nr:ribonuclease III [Butyrivibrio sp.]MBE5841841.1 ribonuclease III [Butyrivibrio sp.]MCR4757576.1 ribonuclease III [Butyrivibrio sp.]